MKKYWKKRLLKVFFEEPKSDFNRKYLKMISNSAKKTIARKIKVSDTLNMSFFKNEKDWYQKVFYVLSRI